MSVEGQYQAARWFQDTDGRWVSFLTRMELCRPDGFRMAAAWYYLATDTGAMKTGWHQDPDGKWYFLLTAEPMQTGLIKVDQKVYYMGTERALFTGIRRLTV